MLVLIQLSNEFQSIDWVGGGALEFLQNFIKS